MRHQIIKKLLTATLAAAILATALPADFTLARAAAKPGSDSTLAELGIIDDPQEEDTENDLPDTSQISTLKSTAEGGMVIALDPGHGGTDSGAAAGGLLEKDLNLTIATYLKSYLEEYDGVQVYLTRSTDTYVELSKRVSDAVANDADVFISLHNNSSTSSSANGTMVFYPNASYNKALNTEGKELATSILSSLTTLGLTNLGVRTRDSENGTTYSDGSIADYYSIIRNAKKSGLTGLIVEHAFVSSASDRSSYLNTSAKLKKLAQADAQGIAAYYGLAQGSSLDTPALTLSAPKYKTLEVTWNAQEEATGYQLYRSETKDGTYTKLAQIVGSENTVYVDENITVGKTYYYKVRSYTRSGGTTQFSGYSTIVEGKAIGGTSLTNIKQLSSGYLKLTWKAYTEGDGYVVYRSENGGSYTAIATINNTATTTYADRTAEPGNTYSYRIRTLNNLYGNQGYGKWSAIAEVSFLADPVMKRIDLKDSGKLKVFWTKTPGASKYVLQRSTESDSGFKTIATITDASTNSYLDADVERGRDYYYRVAAFNQKGIVTGSTGYVAPLAVRNLKTPEITKASISDDTPGVELSWTQTPAAEGYRIYRSTKQSGGYTKIATVKSGDTLHYLDETKTTAGTTYYYKVTAYIHNSTGIAASYASTPKGVVAGFSIMGESTTTVAKMVAFYTARGGEYPSDIYSAYGAPTLKSFCQIVYDEAKAEGVKAEVVFAQVCKETGFLRFGGDVQPEQCNFAGIGATGGVTGSSFPDVATGIRAQVQHLKAYASDEPLNNTCVDPRFTYVKRCAAIYVEWLGTHENPTGAGWATGVNYGYSLRDDYIKPLLSY